MMHVVYKLSFHVFPLDYLPHLKCHRVINGSQGAPALWYGSYEASTVASKWLCHFDLIGALSTGALS